MSTTRKGIGRRGFIRRAAVAAASLAGVSYLALLSARRTDEAFLEQLSGFQTSFAPPEPLPGLTDYKGVIHVRAPMPDAPEDSREFFAAAQDAHLQFLMLTDRNDPRRFAAKPSGTPKGIAVIRGSEVVKDGQHLLALGLRDYIDDQHLSLAELVTAVKTQGGLVFASRPNHFRDWNIAGLDGVEVYNVAASARRNAWRAPRMFSGMLTPGRRMPEQTFLRGPLDRPNAALARWDELTQSRKYVGIAGNDAHLGLVPFDGALEPYRHNFAFLQTHLLAPGPDATSLLTALRAGRAYWSYEMLTEATGFQFVAHSETARHVMGDAVPLNARPVLTVHTPQRANIRLFRHGERIRDEDAARFDFVVQHPGVYRAEVHLSIGGVHYPWIFSNPIYVV